MSIFSWFFIKETNGATLEEIDVVFGASPEAPAKDAEKATEEDDVEVEERQSRKPNTSRAG